MNTDKEKILKMGLLLLSLLLLVAGFRYFAQRNSLTLSEYAARNPGQDPPASEESSQEAESAEKPASEEESGEETAPEEAGSADESATENLQKPEEEAGTFVPVGASLNGDSQEKYRVSYQENFYYEPLSENLKRYITGVSFPNLSDSPEKPAISLDDLSYVHIMHYDFEGNPSEGELICNTAIAPDLTEIFLALYDSEYQIEKVRLIDEYDGDDTVSMEDNNTSCFNYRTVDNSTRLSKHAYGLAIDVNPFYNPYVTYEKDGSERISPAASADYADRTKNFPYKIDKDDLCYKLFLEHGFIWGGNWNSSKDYQHFQKNLK